jgi:hypothetical protein
MTLPQTTKTADWTTQAPAGSVAAQLRPAPAKPLRRLPVERDWPPFVIVAVQIGILVGIVALWEIGANTGFIDELWSRDGIISRQAWDTASAVVRATGILRADIKYDEIIDMSFVGAG